MGTIEVASDDGVLGRGAAAIGERFRRGCWLLKMVVYVVEFWRVFEPNEHCN